MKICFLTDSLDPHDGPGRYGVELVAAMLPRLQAANIVLPTHHAAVGDERLAAGALHRLLPARSLLFRKPLMVPAALAAAVRVLPLVRRADVVHALKDHPYSLIAAIACRLARKPLVAAAFGTYSVVPFRSWFEGALLRFELRSAARIICLGDYARRRLAEHIGEDPITVIPGGVDAARFEHEGEKGMPLPLPFILSVGQVKERKGFDLCVSAFRRLAPEFPGLRYYIAGDCSQQSYVRELREMIGADGDSIRLLGPVDAETLAWLYRRCELFVLTPRTDRAGGFEGFGLVYLEAGACSKAVIGARECGAEDAVVDGQTGLLVSPEDVDELTGALRRLLNDRDLAARLGAEGRRRAADLSWERVAERVFEVYRQVAVDHSPRSS